MFLKDSVSGHCVVGFENALYELIYRGIRIQLLALCVLAIVEELDGGATRSGDFSRVNLNRAPPELDHTRVRIAFAVQHSIQRPG